LGGFGQGRIKFFPGSCSNFPAGKLKSSTGCHYLLNPHPRKLKLMMVGKGFSGMTGMDEGLLSCMKYFNRK